jgi:hypothetical protein
MNLAKPFAEYQDVVWSDTISHRPMEGANFLPMRASKFTGQGGPSALLQTLSIPVHKMGNDVECEASNEKICV